MGSAAAIVGAETRPKREETFGAENLHAAVYKPTVGHLAIRTGFHVLKPRFHHVEGKRQKGSKKIKEGTNKTTERA